MSQTKYATIENERVHFYFHFSHFVDFYFIGYLLILIGLAIVVTWRKTIKSKQLNFLAKNLRNRLRFHCYLAFFPFVVCVQCILQRKLYGSFSFSLFCFYHAVILVCWVFYDAAFCIINIQYKLSVAPTVSS